VHVAGKDPFHVWLHRLAALRCRDALVKCNGNRAAAARMVGLKRPAFNLYIEGDNAMLDRRAAAEGWQPDGAETHVPVSE
jgi:hypothetical protein